MFNEENPIGNDRFSDGELIPEKNTKNSVDKLNDILSKFENNEQMISSFMRQIVLQLRDIKQQLEELKKKEKL